MLPIAGAAARQSASSAARSAVLRPSQSLGQQQQVRGAHDLLIKRKTGKPIIKSGPYGGGR